MNPFLNYIGCYAPGTVPERPWWRADRPTVLRLGGYIYRRTDGAETAAYEGEDPFAELDAYDAAHPLPVPPVLPSQVRHDPDTGASFVVSPSAPVDDWSHLPDPDDGASPYCESCRSWHPTPRTEAHHRALGCVAPWGGR